MQTKDQLFSNMYQAALERLKACSPEKISQLGGVKFDGKAFTFESLGQKITVTYPEYQVTPQLSQWHILTILHYLALADGRPLTGAQITFAQQKDGLIRGGGFDRDTEKLIQEKIGLLSPEELEQRCLAQGAVLEQSNADLCARFSFMPHYPVWLKIWFADDEFPPSGRLLLDASAEHYLSIEDSVTAGGVILEKLIDLPANV